MIMDGSSQSLGAGRPRGCVSLDIKPGSTYHGGSRHGGEYEGGEVSA